MTNPQQLFDLNIKGVIKNISPINIVTPNTEITNFSNGDGKAPSLASLPIGRDNGKVENVPVITASTIRGRLRRMAADICLRHTETKPGLKPYLYAVVGGVKSSEKEDTFALSRRNERRGRNPVVALFGASAPWDGSRAFVDNAIPVNFVQQVPVTGIRTDDFVRNEAISELVDSDSFDDYQEARGNIKVTSEAKGETKALIQKRAKAAKDGKTEEVAALDAQIAEARKTEKAAAQVSGNSIQMPHGHFVIPIRTEFTHNFFLKGVTAAEAGLFLKALSDTFAFEPQFGGKASQGYGLISANWNVEIRDRTARGRWQAAGTLVAEPHQDIEIPQELAFTLDAWDAYVASGAMDLTVEGDKVAGRDAA